MEFHTSTFDAQTLGKRGNMMKGIRGPFREEMKSHISSGENRLEFTQVVAIILCVRGLISSFQKRGLATKS